MDAMLKELTKLEALATNTSTQTKSKAIPETLDSFLHFLNDAKVQASSGQEADLDPQLLTKTAASTKKDVEDRQKEIHSTINRLGKAIDKRFATELPCYADLFTSERAKLALERTVALHLLRTGRFETAQTLLEESTVEIPAEIRSQFIALFSILEALRKQEIQPALSWVQRNAQFLKERNSPLEFYLHRSQFLRLLFFSHPPDPVPAIAYAKAKLRPFYMDHPAEFKRLMSCILYIPLVKLKDSPYADLASPSLHLDLEPLFAKEYCASLGMSQHVPLRVVGDIGAGALAKIEKGRRVMRERRSEWSQSNELPIEIPLPAENRYHSIFTCPVSKEQSTDSNPPMMMECGHVISRDSLQKLSKAEGKVKCPYCPMESTIDGAVQVYF